MACGGSDADSNLMIKRGTEVKGKIGNNGKVFLTGSLVQNSSSFSGGINIDNLASLSSSGNMYIKGKVYDGLYTDEYDLEDLNPKTAGPLIFTEDGDLKAYLDDRGNFHTLNCVYEHAPSGTILPS